MVDVNTVGGMMVDVGVVTSRCQAVSMGVKLGVKVYCCGMVNKGGMGVAVCLC